MLEYNHWSPQRPLLGKIDPRAQAVPTEIYLEGLQKSYRDVDNIH